MMLLPLRLLNIVLQCRFSNAIQNANKKRHCTKHLRRMISSLPQAAPSDVSNQAWVVDKSTHCLRLSHCRRPHINAPNDVLVKVKAASVNPLDVRMTRGYGSNILGLYQAMDQVCSVGPTALCFSGNSVSVLGRDFSGVVEDVGQNVSKFKQGDEVFGAFAAIHEGTHQLFTVAPQNSLSIKPSNLNHVEAACIPYVAITFTSAVNPFKNYDVRHKRVYLNGGAGGIATFAIQYLKALDCEVTVAVSPEGHDIVQRLKPDHILNYQSETFNEELRLLSGFDLAFDCVGDDTALSCVRPGGRFVTVVSPLLGQTDELGLVVGGIKSSADFALKVLQTQIDHGVLYNWGFFMEDGATLDTIKQMLENNQIHPVIDEVFSFADTPAAYEKVSKGKGKGKVIIDMAALS